MSEEFDMSAGVDALSAGLFPQAEASSEDHLESDEPSEPEEISEEEVLEEIPDEPAEVPTEETDPNAPPAEPTEETDPLANAPKTWRKEAAAEWANLPPVIKAEIAKREEDMFKGIETYKFDAQVGQNFKNVVGQHLDYLQKANVDPYAEVDGLLQYSKIMRNGTQAERMELLGRVAHEYGVDLLDLAAAVPPPAYIDPAVKALQDQLNALQSTRQQEDTQRQLQVQSEIQSKINAFASAPGHEHFATVETEMAAFINLDKNLSLEEAYKKAIWANPLTRDLELSRQAAETKAQSQAKVAAAKKATAANVKTNARPGSATAPTGSIDDTLAETLAAIRSR